MTIKVRIVAVNPLIQDRPEDWGKPAGWCVEGLEVPFSALTLGDLTDRISETEAHLSRILGLTVKIETASE